MSACPDCTATALCGEHFTPEMEAAGWEDVVDRMDRWSANGYIGDWQETQYDAPHRNGETR